MSNVADQHWNEDVSNMQQKLLQFFFFLTLPPEKNGTIQTACRILLPNRTALSHNAFKVEHCGSISLLGLILVCTIIQTADRTFTWLHTHSLGASLTSHETLCQYLVVV